MNHYQMIARDSLVVCQGRGDLSFNQTDKG
jgi:hypothetical protein